MNDPDGLKPDRTTADQRERIFTERTRAILSGEDRRSAANATKTARLRELRLAKEAAERTTESPGESKRE